MTKRFYYYDHRPTSLREWFIRTVLRKARPAQHAGFALQPIDLRVEPGECVAFIGGNGSGKSSLLRLIAGIYRPSHGTVVTRGRVAPIIELGAGFHPELTGAENIGLYASVLGIDRRALALRWREIIDFSEIDDFLDTPVKYLSTGMQARLAVAVAVCVEPDVLLLDEVLSVGDQAFRARCLKRLREFNLAGGTILLVSHEMAQLRELCSRAIWLHGGAVRLDGPVDHVVSEYGHSGLDPRPVPR